MRLCSVSAGKVWIQIKMTNMEGTIDTVTKTLVPQYQPKIPCADTCSRCRCGHVSQIVSLLGQRLKIVEQIKTDKKPQHFDLQYYK